MKANGQRRFHDLVLRALWSLDRLLILLVPRGFVVQPIGTGEVADRLIELAFSSPAGRVPDVSGPEVLTLGELARTYLEALGHRKRLVEVPAPGNAARAWRDGTQLCPEQTYGSIRWQEFLHGAPSAQTSSETKGEQIT